MKCRTQIASRLKNELGLENPDGKLVMMFRSFVVTNLYTANERCAILLEVDNENQVRRIQLKKEKGTITEAQIWLGRLVDGGTNVRFS